MPRNAETAYQPPCRSPTWPYIDHVTADIHLRPDLIKAPEWASVARKAAPKLSFPGMVQQPLGQIQEMFCFPTMNTFEDLETQLYVRRH